MILKLRILLSHRPPNLPMRRWSCPTDFIRRGKKRQAARSEAHLSVDSSTLVLSASTPVELDVSKRSCKPSLVRLPSPPSPGCATVAGSPPDRFSRVPPSAAAAPVSLCASVFCNSPWLTRRRADNMRKMMRGLIRPSQSSSVRLRGCGCADGSWGPVPLLSYW